MIRAFPQLDDHLKYRRPWDRRLIARESTNETWYPIRGVKTRLHTKIKTLCGTPLHTAPAPRELTFVETKICERMSCEQSAVFFLKVLHLYSPYNLENHNSMVMSVRKFKYHVYVTFHEQHSSGYGFPSLTSGHTCLSGRVGISF